MNDEKGFPHFQWSIFPDGNKGEQYVVRSDDFAVFERNITLIRTKLAGGQTEPLPWEQETKPEPVRVIDPQLKRDVEAVMPDTEEEDELTFCPKHPTERVYYKDGKFGRFFSHGEKQPNGSWINCVNAKGYPR